MANYRKLFKEYWQAHALPHFHSEQVAKTVLEKLLGYYSEPHRTYHNLRHITDLFGKWEEWEIPFKQRKEVGFAIWFHDAVYNPKSKTNEPDSADLAGETLYGNTTLSSCEIEDTCSFIQATAKHLPNSKNPDLRLFIDLDLSILGSDSERYHLYAEEIRQEYKHVPRLLYRLGRKKVLKRLLGKDQLFYTPFFRNRLEGKARQNIRWELAIL